MPSEDLVPIGGLWESQTVNGDSYLGGSFGTARILVFKNKFKERDNQPDFIMYVCRSKKRQEDTEGSDMVQSEVPPAPSPHEAPF